MGARQLVQEDPISWRDCPRISDSFIQEEIQSLDRPGWIRSINCLFTSMEGWSIPTWPVPWRRTGRFSPAKLWAASTWLAQSVCGDLGRPGSRRHFWLDGERYLRETRYTSTPRHCDKQRPCSGMPTRRTNEIEELRAGGLNVRPVRTTSPGIAAVSARLRTVAEDLRRRLPQSAGRGPALPLADSLRAQAAGREPGGRSTIIALGALRYLIFSTGRHFLARLRRGQLWVRIPI